MTPIGQLVEEVQAQFLDSHGIDLTYGDIARRSHGRLTRQRVQQLAKDPIKAMPSPEVIYGLALGLAVPESVVLERALASAGYTGPRQQRREEVRDVQSAANTQEDAAKHRRVLAAKLDAAPGEDDPGSSSQHAHTGPKRRSTDLG